MGFFDFDNIKKYLGWYWRLPRWLRVILPIVVILSFLLYVKLGPVRKLEKENASLKKENASLERSLEALQSELSRLLYRNGELNAENLVLKTIADPMRKMLELLYPKMETAAAIARLGEDVKAVRSLATRDVYRPLDAQKKKELVGKLKAFLGRHTSFTHTVTISYQQVIRSHGKIVADLEQYLEEAGFRVEFGTITRGYRRPPPNISIKFHPDDEEFARQFAAALSPLYIAEKFDGITQETINRGCLEVVINGDPVFTDLGVVKFR